MKKKLQRILVGLSLLVIIPGALLALVTIIASVGYGFQKGFSSAHFVAIPICILPPIMVWWSNKLVFKLYGTFSKRLRRETMFYHGLNLCYCSMWLTTTASRGGTSFPIFGLQERMVGICLLSAPLLITLLTHDDDTHNTRAEQDIAPSDR